MVKKGAIASKEYLRLINSVNSFTIGQCGRKLILYPKCHISITHLCLIPKLIFILNHNGQSSTNTQLKKATLTSHRVLKQRSHFSLAQSQNAKHQIRMSNSQHLPAALNTNYLNTGCAHAHKPTNAFIHHASLFQTSILIFGCLMSFLIAKTADQTCMFLSLHLR